MRIKVNERYEQEEAQRNEQQKMRSNTINGNAIKSVRFMQSRIILIVLYIIYTQNGMQVSNCCD